MIGVVHKTFISWLPFNRKLRKLTTLRLVARGLRRGKKEKLYRLNGRAKWSHAKDLRTYTVKYLVYEPYFSADTLETDVGDVDRYLASPNVLR